MIRRAWINQPSTLQKEHRHHGKNVLVDLSTKRPVNRNGVKGDLVMVYFIEGGTVSQECWLDALEIGRWNK